jgi:uncharacterized protein (TIGR00730 family)
VSETNHALRVCVYCASSDVIDPGLRRTAARLGSAIAAQGWSLVFGGGSVGLMGEVAATARDGGAHVTGVIPYRLADRELAMEGLDELIHTETMSQRKEIMDARSDAFVILPGGIGTLDEFMEVLTLKHLGYHGRALVVLDAENFWTPVLAQLQRMVDEHFAPPDMLELYQATADVDETVEALATYVTPPPRPLPQVELEATEVPGEGSA